MIQQQVVLKLAGDLEHGVQVTLEIWSQHQRQLEITGGLPPNPQLIACSQEHWENYRRIGAPYRLQPESIVTDGYVNRRIEICHNSATQLQEQFEAWLDASAFKRIDRKLRDYFSLNQAVRVLIRTSDSCLQKLPWHLWDWIETRAAEVIFSTPEYQLVSTPKTLNPQIRILAILGHSQGIDVVKDRRLLEGLPNVELVFLVEPTRREINTQLWENNWDILFFAGHGETKNDQGKIYINPHESLTLSELKYGLKQAVESGLKLAIFNSCDGLGLAQELQEIHLPRMILMREIIPDEVAQSFLKYFLAAFANGNSFAFAVRKARERLHDEFETEYPCVSWLPVIFQHPIETDLTWKKLYQPIQNPQSQPAIPRLSRWQYCRKILTASLMITAMIVGVRQLGLLQTWELKALDTLMRLRPEESLDPRLLIVTVTEADIQAQNPDELRGSLSDTTLKQLLETLNQHQPRVIGLDIYRPFPVQPNQQKLAQLLSQSQALIVVCEMGGDEQNPAIPPPDEVPLQQVGFSDVPIDPDGIVRRQFLGMSHHDQCNTDKSFSHQLAYQYLTAEAIPFQRTSRHTYQIGSVFFNKLKPSTAGYHQLDARGYQVMLNYRTSEAPAQTITLSDILNNRFDPQLIQDKIILIGTTARSIDDGFLTPYSLGYSPIKSIPGVFIQAQMVSQILSAVQDDRPLLQVLPKWKEFVLILACAVTGETLFILFLNSQKNTTAFYLVLDGFGLIIIGGMGYIALLMGIWIPIIPIGLALVLVGVKRSFLLNNL
ncbi:MAG: CHASE2 domain-containing protein [Microcoleaceae cyanobacterium]